MLLLNLDFNAVNLSKKTPFALACTNGYKKIVELLLKEPSIDVNKAENYGRTPFFLACSNGHKEIVELLLKDSRVDVNKADDSGDTPFAMSCGSYKEIVELLLKDDRIDVNKADNNGWTPFARACRFGRTETAELLLKDARIDVNKPDNDGESPFWRTCSLGYKKIVELLLQDSRLDLSKELEKAAFEDPLVSGPVYRTLGEALCSAETILLSQNLISVTPVSKILALVGNIKTISSPSHNDAAYNQLEIGRSKIFSSMEKEKTNDLKAKLKAKFNIPPDEVAANWAATMSLLRSLEEEIEVIGEIE